MRKNTVKKWIFGAIKCLPLLVIPIFAIYSQRHTIDNNSVVVGGYEYCNKYESNEVNSYTDLIVGNIYSFDVNSLYNDSSSGQLIMENSTLIFVYNDNNSIQYFSPSFEFYRGRSYFEFSSRNNGVYLSFDVSMGYSFTTYLVYGVVANNSLNVDLYNYLSFTDYNVIDYVYNDFITYNDTDIGSQFIYQMYNVTDKYFNFTNMFNLNSVRDWLVLNMFGGNAPLTINIVWNILVYEIFIDFILLMYCILTFVVEVATNMLDSFTRRNGGK